MNEPNYPASSDDLIREWRTANPSTPVAPPATDAPSSSSLPEAMAPAATSPAAPPAAAPPATAPPATAPATAPPADPADPFGARPATEPYQPGTAPATGDDRHADWKPRGRTGMPTAERGRSTFGKLRIIGLIAFLAVSFGGGILSFFDSSTTVDQLAVGDCFNDPGPEVEFVEKVETVDCAEAHDFEVFHIPAYGAPANAAFPGDITLFEWADGECWDAFEGYVGTPFEQSELYFANMVPSAESWAQGDRAANCMLMRLDDSFEIERVTGSQRNSGI